MSTEIDNQFQFEMQEFTPDVQHLETDLQTEAFRAIYPFIEENLGNISRLATRILGYDINAVPDVLQNVLISAWRNAPEIQEELQSQEKKLLPWLNRVTYNKSIDE